MLRVLKDVVHRTGHLYVQQVNKSEWMSQVPGRLNERAVEYGFVFNCLAELAPSTVLDVGAGTTALPSLLRTCNYRVTAIDNISDYWPHGMRNRHFYVLDDDITGSKLTEQYDIVLCISVLEHVVEYERALATMASLTKPGGHVLITCPYGESAGSANCYDREDSYGKDFPFICRQFTRTDFEQWCHRTGAELVKQEWWRFFDSQYWSCGKQVQPPQKVRPHELHQHSCLLARIPE